VAAGQQLRLLRQRRGITLRDVQQASRRIADAKGDPKYRISNGWLVQLENCDSPPNIFHLFALGATYRVPFLEFLRLYDIDINEQEKYEVVANPQLTQLLSPDNLQLDSIPPSTSTRLAPDVAAKLPLPISFEQGNGDSKVAWAQLGTVDLTMHPLIRPGSVLKIDTSQNKIQSGLWNNEFERPIYFVELRDGWACGWCELHGNQLLIIPYLSSSANVRQFTYPRDAEIVGRVVGYYTRCVDADRL
jgi:transcriptional regulator with XRE-family HTH domain